MPITECYNCGQDYNWSWEEAFDKFGFMDGDGQVETYQVEAVLTEAGYDVEIRDWGLHNTIICSIKKGGRELIPENVNLGYDDPRSYLPQDIIALLDTELEEERR